MYFFHFLRRKTIFSSGLQSTGARSNSYCKFLGLFNYWFLHFLTVPLTPTLNFIVIYKMSLFYFMNFSNVQFKHKKWKIYLLWRTMVGVRAISFCHPSHIIHTFWSEPRPHVLHIVCVPCSVVLKHFSTIRLSPNIKYKEIFV